MTNTSHRIGSWWPAICYPFRSTFSATQYIFYSLNTIHGRSKQTRFTKDIASLSTRSASWFPGISQWTGIQQNIFSFREYFLTCSYSPQYRYQKNISFASKKAFPEISHLNFTPNYSLGQQVPTIGVSLWLSMDEPTFLVGCEYTSSFVAHHMMSGLVPWCLIWINFDKFRCYKGV